ncbi:hypothetical protein D8674_017583 [Pyrus ussuriensis x Pyrus communis]|uniref:Reverse transcriptase Ty1/copia-type domain-containing protein n=1 Tax=Pyrus ussuriensis x Pyrus communis TaxID=2448454 RepID=A0A5N5HH58_9ROSA|nr:hypothetical protein D8674_017583 [Pyrus ussuriensis x Pyrus communis]
MALEGGSGMLKLEGSNSTNNPVLNPVVIQSDASAVPNTVKLNGSNYPLWSKVLEMHIAGRGRKGFVTGSTKEPAKNSAEYETWETGNAIVKGWLINSMEPAIMGFFIHLHQRRPIKMECVVDLKTLREERQIDRVYAFLAGLDDVFDKVRSDILRTQPLPSVEEVFSVVRREAQRHATMMGGNNNHGGLPSMAMISRPVGASRPSNSSTQSLNSRPFNRENKDDLKCTFYGQTRHTEDTCFTKHGVPDWFPELKKILRAKERGAAGSSGGCASLATATPTVQEAVPSPSDSSQNLLTRTRGDSSFDTGTTKEIIGRGTKREGLYYVDDVVSGRANAVRASRSNAVRDNGAGMPRQIVAESGMQSGVIAAESDLQSGQVVDKSTDVTPSLSSSTVLPNESSLDIPEFDVKNAFLHGNLEEEVYMDFPPGYSDGRNTGVCRLRKSLYGLKQSPRAWFDRFTRVMKKIGYYQSHSDHTLFVKQRHGKYLLDLLKETGMLGCKPVDTPIVEKHHLCLDPNQKSVDKGRYQRLVGRLIYLAHTRPDIAYAVSVVSQFMHSPSVDHMAAVMWFTDADWAGSVGDRRSTSGYFTFVGGNLVTWRSKKQKVVSRSSAEAEYRGMAHGISDNPVQHDRTKHVEVDRHFIKEKLERKIVSIPFVNTEEQLADVLTHAVCSRKFDDSLVKLGMCDIYAPT